MAHFKPQRFTLPVLAIIIALIASAFVYSPKHASVVTSYFANESHAAGGVSVGASVPSGYTRVTPAVATLGVSYYETVHCSGPFTTICLVEAQGSAGDPQSDFVIIAIWYGTWQ